MKATAFALLSMAIALCTCPAHAGIRCENDLISPGETTFEVQVKLGKCGEVLNKEVVGTQTTKEKKADDKVEEKEKVVERWYIRVQERGGMYCYPLTFEDGLLTNIGNWTKCD